MFDSLSSYNANLIGLRISMQKDKRTSSEIHRRCVLLMNKKKSPGAARFFKTGKGQYGEGDVFLGISVPTTRKIALEFKELSLLEIEKLFFSKFHEERLIGIHILKLQYLESVKRQDENQIKNLYRAFYNLRSGVNNWDLVDSSAPYISGHYFYHFSEKDLRCLNQSGNLWERRIAVLSCFYYIKQEDFKVPLKIIKERLYDDEDLMHKACGWMLREIGKRNLSVLRKFLKIHSSLMPRTALRYAIEKMTKLERRHWMSR